MGVIRRLKQRQKVARLRRRMDIAIYRLNRPGGTIQLKSRIDTVLEARNNPSLFEFPGSLQIMKQLPLCQGAWPLSLALWATLKNHKTLVIQLS